ncbi:hypothetical protein [Acinetobacter baumannii]|uniref:hypothetical protein n=1 Tax=Acinetobacter baumannii TaxID=470 RepID=UPI001D0F0F6E|nr:hypothetical protein [Acinetobacter baumannii]
MKIFLISKFRELLLGNSSFLCLSKVLQNKNINLDLGVVQLAVGLMISGPVRLVVGSAQSLGMDALAGPYKKKGIDVLATAFTASAHSTSTDVVEKMINPQYAKEVPEAERDNYESLSNELSSSKQGAEYLINAAAGIVVGGIGKGAVKNNNSDIDISKSGFEIGNINPITGHKILGTHKDESNNTVGNYIVEGTKPSTKDKVIKTDIQYYENPGHHDPKGGNQIGYNKTKSVLPDNHKTLWDNSIVASDGNRWAVEVINGKKVYHRFQNDGNGNFHWNGSTNGITASGVDRSDVGKIPPEILRK